MILLALVVGCSFYNPSESSSGSTKSNAAKSSNSGDESLQDEATDSAIGEEKIGIPECDEVIDFFAEQANSEDDGYLTKATKGYALNKVRESFKKSIEENKGDTKKMAKECRDFKNQLDKYKPADNSNKK